MYTNMMIWYMFLSKNTSIYPMYTQQFTIMRKYKSTFPKKKHKRKTPKTIAKKSLGLPPIPQSVCCWTVTECPLWGAFVFSCRSNSFPFQETGESLAPNIFSNSLEDPSFPRSTPLVGHVTHHLYTTPINGRKLSGWVGWLTTLYL